MNPTRPARYIRHEYVTHRLNLTEILGELLTAEQLKEVEGFEVSAHSESSREDGPNDNDDVLVVSFKRTQQFTRDAAGQLVAEPKEDFDCCVTKKQLEKVFAERFAEKFAALGEQKGQPT